MRPRARHSQPPSRYGASYRLVRPRRVWLGLVLALAGCALLGLALSAVSIPIGVVGLGLLVFGAAVGVRAGGMYDVHSSAPGQEVREVIEGDIRMGVAPSDRITSESAGRTAREVTERTRRLHEERRRVSRPPLAPVGAVVVIAVAVFLLVAQWEIYPLGRVSQHNARRVLIVAVIATLAALRILVGRPARHGGACLLLFLSGAALVAQAYLLDHEIAATTGVEAVTGASVLAAALACTLSPTPAPITGE